MSDESWMRDALAALIDAVENDLARRALSDDDALGEIRALLDRLVVGVPAGDRGDNLVRALIALRVKFSPDEARAKLETNLAMRRPAAVPDRQ